MIFFTRASIFHILKIDPDFNFHIIYKMSCPICTENFNGSTRKNVTCLKCKNSCCRSCAQRYLLELASTPHCMNCKHGWDIKFLIDNLSKTFVNKKYKDRRKELLFNIERSRIPSTMSAVENFIRKDKLMEENKALGKIKHDLQRRVRDINEQIWRNQNIMRHGKKQIVNYTFTQPCPIAVCKGFLSTGWKCQVCNTNICAQCREVKGENHVCNEDTVKTVQLLKKDTKPCPSCGEGIFKISGCDQMWCTGCKVPFSWKTGRVVTGTVHNPHYYQFMRDNRGAVPRAPGDVRCGGMPPAHELRIRVHAAFKNQLVCRQTSDLVNHRSKEQAEAGRALMGTIELLLRHHQAHQRSSASILDWICRVHMHLNHFRLTERRAVLGKIVNNSNEQDRIQYIMNRIDEKKFKYKLAKKDTAFRKNTDISNIYNLVNTVCTEQFILMYNSPTQQQIFESMIACEQLRLYANAELKKIRDTYKHKTPEFTPLFRVVKL